MNTRLNFADKVLTHAKSIKSKTKLLLTMLMKKGENTIRYSVSSTCTVKNLFCKTLNNDDDGAVNDDDR